MKSFDGLSLAEVCASLGQSVGWVQRVERDFGLSGRSGLKGVRSRYGKDEQALFHHISLCRAQGISFDLLKRMYRLEKKISQEIERIYRRLPEPIPDGMRGWDVNLVLHEADRVIPWSVLKKRGKGKISQLVDEYNQLTTIVGKKIDQQRDSLSQLGKRYKDAKLCNKDFIRRAK